MSNELQKYTDVLMELVQGQQHSNRLADLVHHLENAADIYRIHYGVWHKSYKEIMQKLNIIKRWLQMRNLLTVMICYYS